MSVPGDALGGIPGSDTKSLIQQILARGQKAGAQIGDTESQFTASQGREAAARGAQAAALKPVQEQQRAMLTQGAPQPPEMAATPVAPTAPKIDAKEMSDTLALITGLAAIGGAFTRQPLTAALNSFSQGVHGYVQGKQDVFQNSLKEFQANLTKAKSDNDATWKKYEAARSKYGTDIQGLQTEAGLIAAETQNPIDMELAKRGDLVSLMKLRETANNNFDKVMGNVLKIQEQAQSHKDATAAREEAAADRRTATQLAHEDRLAIAGMQHQDRQSAQASKAGGAAGNTRNSLVKAGATNALNRMSELKTAGDGAYPTASVMFGQHGDGVVSGMTHAAGQAMLSTEQQKIDADYASLVDESIPVFTGGLRGSDAFRKFLMGQLPRQGDDPETANEKMRLFEANINGTLNTFGGVAKVPGMTQGAGGAGAPAGGAQTFATEAEAEKAGLAPGTRVIIGGKPGTWQ